jgi:hypothetical protein
MEEYSLLKARKSAIVTRVQDTLYWNDRRKNKSRYELLKELDKEFDRVEARINEIEVQSKEAIWKRN